MNKIYLLLLLSILTSCAENKKPSDTNNNQKTTEYKKEIKVEFKNQIETICILQDLWVEAQGGWPYSKYNNPVKEDISSFFDSVKEHKAISMTYEITESDLSFSGPLLVALHLSEFPNAKPIYDLSNLNDKAPNNSTTDGKLFITEYIEQLNDFYITANVAKFLESHKYYYDKVLQEIKKNIPNEEVLMALEKYHGTSFENYYFIPTLTNFAMAFGHKFEKNGRYNVYQVSAINENINDSLNTYGFTDKDEIIELSFHEYGHSFVELNPEIVKKTEYLFDDISDGMKADGYGNWENALDEHIVRAIEIRIWEKFLKNDFQANKLRNDYKAYKYIPFIEEQLKVYENNRNQYPTFESFLPILLKSLETIKK